MNALEQKSAIDGLVRMLLDRLPAEGSPITMVACDASAEGVVPNSLEAYAPIYVLERLGFVRVAYDVVVPGERFEEVRNMRAAFSGRRS